MSSRFSDHLFSQIIQNMRLNAINSFPVALFRRQVADDRSIVSRQSFVSLSVDRLSIDTFVSRLSLIVGRTSILERPTLERLSVDIRSTYL